MWVLSCAASHVHFALVGMQYMLFQSSAAGTATFELSTNRYETWRRKELSKPQVRARLRGFVIATVLPAMLAVYVAQRGVDMEQVRYPCHVLGMLAGTA